MAGSIAKQLLETYGITIHAYVSQVGPIQMPENKIDYHKKHNHYPLNYYGTDKKYRKQPIKDNMVESTQVNTLSDKISDFLKKQQRYLSSLSLA